MAMNNPFLVRKPKAANTTFSLGSELRRLFGSPLRAPLTLLLVLLPLLLSLAGAVDFVQSWLYSISHKGAADKRQVAFFVDCLTNNPTTKVICAGQKIGRSKMQFWPFMPVTTPLPNGDTASSFFGLGQLLSQPQPFWFLGLFLLAVMAFVGIGNPNLSRIGPLLADAFGFKSKTKTRTKAKAKKLNDKNEGITTDLDTTTNKAIERFEHELLPPPRLADEKELPSNWIIGGTLLREWAADPGLFYLKQDGNKPAKSKNVLAERPPYFLVGDVLRTNLMIVAPQGSGKTTSVFRPAINFIRRSGGVGCVWDSKGNDFNAADFTYNFDLEDFERSFHLCVFSGRTAEEAGERLAEAMIPELSEDKRYFSDIAKDALSAIVAGHCAVYERFPELTQILLYINKDSASLQELIEDIPARVENRDEIERLMGNLVRVQTLVETKGDLLGNLRTALTPLTSPQISRFLAANPDPTNNIFTIEGLLKEPGLIRLGLPVADRPRVAPILGRLILAQLVFAVLSPRCNRDILKLAVVDEAHNFVSLPICKGMAQARSNNAGFMLAFQTLSQIPNDSMLETIFSLAGTKLVMGGVGNKDAERFSRTFGKVWLEFISHSTNTGRSTNSNTGGSRTSGSFMEFGASSESGSSSKATTNYGRSNSKTTGQGENTQLHERALFSDYEIRTLPQHHAIIESANTYGERWQAQIIDMSQNTVRTLETAFTDEANRLLCGGQDKKKDKNKKKKGNDTDEKPHSGPASGPEPDDNGWNGPRPKLGPGSAHPTSVATITDLALREPESARLMPTSNTWGRTGLGQHYRRGQGQGQARVRFSVVGATSTTTSSTMVNQSQPGQIQPINSDQSESTTIRVRDESPKQPSTDILVTNFIRPATQEIGEVADGKQEMKFETTNVGDGPVLSEQKQPGQPEPTHIANSDPAPASLPDTELIREDDVVKSETGIQLASTDALDQPQPSQNHQNGDLESNENKQQLIKAFVQALQDYGIDPLSTGWMSQALVNNGRDMAYLRHLAAKPNVKSLPGYLNWAISNNFQPKSRTTTPSIPGRVVAKTLHSNINNDGSHEPGIVEQQPLTSEQVRQKLEFERIKQSLIGAGVAQNEIEKLANIALDNGRDYAYVAALIAHPRIESLPAWLNWSITGNLAPTEEKKANS